MTTEATENRPLADLRELEIIRDTLSTYYTEAGDFIQSVEQARTVEDLMAVDINARAIAGGVSRMMFDQGWLTPEGRILKDEVTTARKTMRALNAIAAKANMASFSAPDELPDGELRAGRI